MFERFYVCFDGCNNNFFGRLYKSDCMDDWWLKGANNGNLLYVIGRNANNHVSSGIDNRANRDL